jgi:glycosyltransferase involved in cell wall biosynthesis
MTAFRDITLAVATFNQAELLLQFIERFEILAPQGLMLILVDDGSNDSTPEVLRKLEQPGRIESLRIQHAGAAAARNTAIARCDTTWIAFTDTDCILDAEYFRVLLTLPVQFPEAAAVEGSVIPPHGPKPPLTHWLENANGGTFATANMLLKVAAARTLGGFDIGFPSNLREDTDFGLTLIARYGRVPFCSEWKVHHPYVRHAYWPSWRRAYRRQGDLVTAELRLYAKHADSYRKVRRLPDAHLTLHWWCRWHAPFYARTYWPWLRQRLAPNPVIAIKAVLLYSAACILALYEQACLNLHYRRYRNVKVIP